VLNNPDLMFANFLPESTPINAGGEFVADFAAQILETASRLGTITSSCRASDSLKRTLIC
jgi:hypothetical protein